jgi:hypothetical protein
MPFIVRGRNECLFAWNILTAMKFHSKWKYYNNGFLCADETRLQYQNRLLHIAAKLNNAAQAENPVFICLQECPEVKELRDDFISALKNGGVLKKYGMDFLNNAANGCYLMTLYDEQRYTIAKDLSDKMQVFALHEGLNGRVLPLVFLSINSDEKILVVNVHADFTNDIQNDIKALYQYAKELDIDNVIFLGDFNRDLVAKSDNYSKQDVAALLDANGRFDNGLFVRANSAASFCAKYDKETGQEGQELETRDGAMAAFQIEVISMPEVNRSDIALSFTNQISPNLSTIPQEFLEKFRDQQDLAIRARL